MKNLVKNLIFILLIFLLLSGVFSSFLNPSETKKEIPLSQLINEINQDKIKSIVISGTDLEIEYKDGTKALSRKEPDAPLSDSLANYGVDKEKLKSVSLTTKKEESSWLWLGPLLTILPPILLIIFLFWIMFSQAKTGAMQAFNFSKARARLFGDGGQLKEKVTF